MQDLGKTTVRRAGTGRRKMPHCWQKGLEISGEGDLTHAFHSGQTAELQEVEGQEAASPRGQQPPRVLLASSSLATRLRGLGPRSARSAVKTGQFQVGPGNRGVPPRNLVGS